jgi:sulfatase maturation enzyme AslB (radical SAM superfamily)
MSGNELESATQRRDVTLPEVMGNAAHPAYRKFLEEVCQENPQIFIELSSICNFNCFYCESPNHSRKAQMDDDLFYQVLDQVCQMTTQPI